MLHILLVEDNRVLREAITALLKSRGYKVTSTETGQAALEVVSDSVDLLLLDWQLPDTLGHVLLEQIRSHFPDLPCVLSSANHFAGEYVKGFEATTFIHKPYEIGALLSLMHPIDNLPF